MKLPRKRFFLLVPLALLALVYIGAAVMLALRDDRIPILGKPATDFESITIFGASGTAGDGILEAALANPDIQKIHVITRRSTPRIEQGVAAGKVQATLHQDYLDYSALEDQLVAADAVYWAIGISSLGVDEKTYGTIHVDYPASFVAKWLSVSDKPAISFHYISSSDISEDSSAMWAREKVRAERTLFALAEGTKLRVISYRPDYIGPTDEEAHLGQRVLYWFFAPIGAAVKAEQIGKAMIEVTARSDEFVNGARLGTRSIIRYGDAYDRRLAGEPVKLDSVFNIDEVAFVKQPGTSTVSGTAFLKLADGTFKDCAGFKVELLPLAAYSKERIVRTYGNDQQGQILMEQSPPKFMPDAPEYHEMLITGACDARGEFNFSNVPAGDYFVMVFIIWEDASGAKPRNTGGAVMKRIRVPAESRVEVLLRN